MASDSRLVRGLKAVEPRAFEELIDSYGARVHRLVRRYVENPSDAEDVTQEVFIDIFRGIAGFREDSSLMSWIYRIAVNHALKSARRAGPDSVPHDDAGPERVTDWRGLPEVSAERAELCQQVQCALGGLAPHHRDVVILHELHGLTYRECAAALEIPVGTGKSRLSNAFRRLEARLAGYVLEPPEAAPADVAVG